MRRIRHGRALRNKRARIGIALVCVLLCLVSSPALAKAKLVWFTMDLPSNADAPQELARRFMEIHPGIEIEIILAGGPAWRDKLQVAIATNTNPPDLFNHYFPANVARHGYMEDLTPYIERDGLDPHKLWFPAARVRGLYNDRYYGSPSLVNPSAMGYNPNIFEGKRQTAHTL